MMRRERSNALNRNEKAFNRFQYLYKHIKNTIEQYNTDHIELRIYVPSQIQLEGDIKSPEVLKYIGEIEHFLQNNYNIEYYSIWTFKCYNYDNKKIYIR